MRYPIKKRKVSFMNEDVFVWLVVNMPEKKVSVAGGPFKTQEEAENNWPETSFAVLYTQAAPPKPARGTETEGEI